MIQGSARFSILRVLCFFSCSAKSIPDYSFKGKVAGPKPCSELDVAIKHSKNSHERWPCLRGISVGAMPSYAALAHKKMGGKLELGGPAAFFCLVVAGGFQPTEAKVDELGRFDVPAAAIGRQ